MNQPPMRPRRRARRARLMRVVNVPMRRLLRLPFRTPLNRRLILLTFTGRKTGRMYRQPVSYVPDGDTLLTPAGGRWKLTCVRGSRSGCGSEGASARATRVHPGRRPGRTAAPHFVLDRDQWLGRFGNGLENQAFAVQDAQERDYGAAVVVVVVVVVVEVLAQETSFQGGDNSGRFRLTLVAVRPTDRWLLAGAHIGMLQQPAGPPPS
jgi:hypothetical protein